MDKKCPKCKLILPLSNFNWKIRNVRYAVYCKDCSKKYTRDHYGRSREYYINKARKRDSKIRGQMYDFISNYFLNHPCIDCAEKDILVLEFDHRDRASKESNISSIIRYAKPMYKLIEEISKCDVRCAIAIVEKR